MEISASLSAPDRLAQLRQKAMELETAFLAEMLGHAGLDAEEGAFAGGVGEEQFSSFLRDAQAKVMVQKGGIGLAEAIFKSLVRAEGRSHD